ncbi:MAG: DUF6228 family protein [Solirubrobacteraceae bacterium]|nr:DUF6228 family protein [Solirubrobacteraceae bacterium]
MNYVDIVSRFGDVTLRVTPIRHPWDTETTQPAWDIQLTGPELDVSGRYFEDPESPQTLPEFCAELAEHHKGWDGDKGWQSAGGDITLRANHDQVNTTRLQATLTGGVVPRWTAYSELHVDPFRFDQVAKNLELYGGELFGDEYDPEAEPVRRDPRQLARDPVRRIGTPDPR